MKRVRWAFLAALSLLLVACASEPEPYVERPVEEIYNDAVDLLLAGDYGGAAREFDEVERQHPYSQWATRAQVMAAFAYYENANYDEAIFAADRFIQLHPGHKDVAYAYYLIGQSYYERISDVKRDQRMSQLAQDAFRTVRLEVGETALREKVRRFRFLIESGRHDAALAVAGDA